MPIGVLVNAAATAIGGLVGVLLSRWMHKEFCNQITMVFAICSMMMGVVSIVKMVNLPAVVLAMIVGTILGELLRIETRIISLTKKVQAPLNRLMGRESGESGEAFMVNFISILVLFCTGGTGIFGSLQSGITGDHTILFAKAILDLFTAAIFAASLGYIVALIALPQCVIFLLLFYGAKVIMPLITPDMLADFTACGGVTMLAAGFRIAGLKAFPIANMIPAMALVLAFSDLWTRFCK